MTVKNSDYFQPKNKNTNKECFLKESEFELNFKMNFETNQMLLVF